MAASGHLIAVSNSGDTCMEWAFTPFHVNVFVVFSAFI